MLIVRKGKLNMEILIILALLVILDVAAHYWGFDSTDRIPEKFS